MGGRREGGTAPAWKVDPPNGGTTAPSKRGTMIFGGGGKVDDGENKGRKLRQAPPRRHSSTVPRSSHVAISDET